MISESQEPGLYQYMRMHPSEMVCFAPENAPPAPEKFSVDRKIQRSHCGKEAELLTFDQDSSSETLLRQQSFQPITKIIVQMVIETSKIDYLKFELIQTELQIPLNQPRTI